MITFIPKSIKTRVTAFTFMTFIFGIFGLSTIVSRTLENDMVTQIGERQLTVVNLLARQINYDLQQQINAMVLVAESLGLTGLHTPSVAQEQIENRPLLLREFSGGVYVLSADGEPLASTPYPATSSDLSELGGDISHMGAHHVGEPMIRSQTGSPVIPFSVPIKNTDGAIVGRLVAVMDLSMPNFLDSLSDSTYGQAGYYLLQDKSAGVIITSTGKARMMEPQGVIGADPLRDRHLQGIEGTSITSNSDGVEVLDSSVSLSTADWMVAAVLPTAEAFAPIVRMQREVLMVALVMATIAAILTWWMLRHELNPLFRTVDKLAELSKSTVAPALLPVSSQNEIGELVEGFNGLLAILQQQRKELQESEFRWKFAIEGAGDGLWDWNLQKETVFYSKTWKNTLGYTDDEVSDDIAEWERRVHPDDRAAVMAALQSHLEEGSESFSSEHRLLTRDKGYKWILARGLVVSRDAEGRPVRVIGIHTDITERKRQESYKELRNHILERLVEGESMELTLREVLTGIERIHSEMRCSILLLDRDREHFVTVIAPSLPGFYNEALIGMKIGIGQGSCGTAAFLREPVIVDDISTSPSWGAYKNLAQRAGVNSCWSQPIYSSSREVLGTFAIYHRHTHKPSAADIALIEELARLSSLAIVKNISDYDQRIAATAFEITKGMLITDPENTILRINHALTVITGFSAQELVGKKTSVLSSGQHDKYFYEEMWRCIKETGVWEGEISNKRKSGELYPQYLIINSVKNSEGEIINYVASIEDLSAAKAASERIHNLDFYDSLTQLPNRRLLMDRLNHAYGATRHSNRKGALLLIDVDHFKMVNEAYGYEIGNMLLKQIAERVNLCLPLSSTLARIGADEFVVLLEDLNPSGLDAAAETEAIANKILYSLSQPFELDSHMRYCTVSIGITLFDKNSEGYEGLVTEADIAMSQAKVAGRNLIRFFDPQMQAAISVRADLEMELRHAVEAEQFQLYYQLQMDNDGRVVGAEALLRWPHPERGFIPPGTFIPVAEESGLILPIGDWVLETACAQLHSWHAHPKTRGMSLSVNVSAKQFNQNTFVSQLESNLRRYAIDPLALKLELTESMLLDDIDLMIEKMSSLQKMGVGFELDDFGTGYSSLQYLKRLPLQQLKIDQSFVRDLVNDDSDKAIVSTIINMAHSLNLQVVAEGVETQQQVDFLRQHGCDHYQGYFYSRPLPIDDCNLLLDKEQIV